VVVFDPLALTLLLAATKTFEWERGINVFATKRKDDPFEDWTQEDFDKLNKSMQDVKEDQHTHIPVEDYYRSMNTTNDNLIDPYIADSTKKSRWAGFGFPMSSIFNKKEEPVEEPVEQLVIDDEIIKEDPTDLAKKEARRRWKEENPNDTLHHQENLFNAGAIKELPWFNPKYYFGLEADNSPAGPIGEVKGFGIAFPKETDKGDMYLRVDQIPSVLYKFNGRNWIEVDKGLTDQHAYDEAYIEHLISKIESGEYDPDLLSDAERDAIEKRLR
jgi:hypothetical protein